MKRLTIVLVAVILSLTACGQGTSSGDTSGSASRPTWQEQYDLGVRYLSEGNYEEAIIAFTAAIEIDPRRASAYVGRGDAYVELAKPEIDLTFYGSAEEDYLSALELDNQTVEVYEKLSKIYLALDEPERAFEILQQGYSVTGNEELLRLADEAYGQVTVVWTDATLEQMIRDTIDIPEGTVYVRDLDYISSLVILGNTHTLVNEQCYGDNGHAAYGFRHINANTGELVLLYNVQSEKYTERGSIVNIDSFRYFRNLRNISVIANHINDISILHELHNLKSANFFANDIADTSLLEEINGDNKVQEWQEQFIDVGDYLRVSE